VPAAAAAAVAADDSDSDDLQVGPKSVSGSGSFTRPRARDDDLRRHHLPGAGPGRPAWAASRFNIPRAGPASGTRSPWVSRPASAEPMTRMESSVPAEPYTDWDRRRVRELSPRLPTGSGGVSAQPEARSPEPAAGEGEAAPAGRAASTSPAAGGGAGRQWGWGFGSWRLTAGA
jgi:hypothetical protein